jgi:CMP/dCMP kinase
MSASSPVIAVDGPAGSGKSSVCRGAAQKLGARYLDTGAMYRAITWAVLNAGIDPIDAEAVSAFARTPQILSGTDPATPTIHVNGVDVGVDIRGSEVTSAVSPVSAVAAVRARLVELQRTVVEQAQSDEVPVVVEGRDIGTVVLPDADLKIFLTADPAVRAARRAKEQGSKDVAGTQQALEQRDAYDSGRAESPLAKADDAVVVDTSDMTLAEVIDHVCALAETLRS